MSRSTPIYPCRNSAAIKMKRNPPPSHPLQSPEYIIPPSISQYLTTAATHLHEGRAVAFTTETVYGLGASSLNPSAVRKIYEIKNRPSDNPLIIHVSSLDMLSRLLPSEYTISPLYLALITTFWPGPLTLLFPSIDPPPSPAPQTNAIRMPSHPLALALIHQSNLPLSAPSANSSGRPSPTKAQHVFNDLNGAEGLGCILDGGDCVVGVESTVVNGLSWKEGGGGFVDILRPGGLDVEEIARIVAQVDDKYGGETDIRLHGRRWTSQSNGTSSTQVTKVTPLRSNGTTIPPSTPGQKYRHYSPRVPVYLLLPSNVFPRPSTSTDISPADIMEVVARLSTSFQENGSNRKVRIGFLHFDKSPLSQQLLVSTSDTDATRSYEIIPISSGESASSAAQRLFSGMLELEGKGGVDKGDDSVTNSTGEAVDAILIEGCSDEGLGLAFMERVGKAVGGGGRKGDLGIGEINGDQQEGRFWVQV